MPLFNLYLLSSRQVNSIKRGFKKFNNIRKYINGWVYIHNLYKELESDKNSIILFLIATIMQI